MSQHIRTTCFVILQYAKMGPFLTSTSFNIDNTTLKLAYLGNLTVQKQCIKQITVQEPKTAWHSTLLAVQVTHSLLLNVSPFAHHVNAVIYRFLGLRKVTGQLCHTLLRLQCSWWSGGEFLLCCASVCVSVSVCSYPTVLN